MKNIFCKMFVFCLSISNLNSYNVTNNINSLIVAPRIGGTILTSVPVIIGLLQDNQKPISNRPVTIYIDKRKVAVVPTDALGVWSYKIKNKQKLSDGIHYMEVSTNPCDNFICVKAIFFYVETSNAKAYRSGNVNANNSQINFPFEDSYINTVTPTIIGSLLDSSYNSVSGETVNIKIDSINVGNPSSNSNGVFSYAITPTGLSEANHTVDAHCVQSSVDLSTNNFVVDVTNPGAPSIISPTENAVLTSNLVVITGTTESLAMITTFIDNDTYGDISYADEAGNWSIEYTLSNGSHSVTAQASDLANNTSIVSGERNFTVNA